MPVDANTLKELIEKELAGVSDARVLRHIRGMLVEPSMVERDWDYEPGQTYPCWMVLKDARSHGEIGYCEYGFGPRCPWGLISSAGESRSIGFRLVPNFSRSIL